MSPSDRPAGGSRGGPLRVLLAFDSFKGSGSAVAICEAVAGALAERHGSAVSVVSRPMADGGEGSLELLRNRLGLETVAIPSEDSLGRAIRAEYLYDVGTGTAYIESSAAAGLPQVLDRPLRATEASSYGVGLLARDALLRGATRIVLFLGGTATSDAGGGILSALGARLLDRAGREIARGGGALGALASVDVSGLMPEARAAEWLLVSDVEARLTGPDGPARGFSPQKGATPEQVRVLDAALRRAGEVLERLSGRELAEVPGMGAAGAMPLFPSALLDARLSPGGAFFAETLGVSAAAGEADVILTGEGRFDEQSFAGKVVGTLERIVREQPEPPLLVVIAGATDRPGAQRDSAVTASFSIAAGPAGLDELQADAARLAGAQAAEVIGLILAARRDPVALPAHQEAS